ncbi:hypothetical protein KVR01_007492 [Diaporthe batatas]|uniref:uncharacterized protein n=1 Tax=Diaporthe batatas TaxID=748121 RepID=UPI001D052DE1|nr:uncharacterized protein KVR01_007492 [Diaporthe batatas]KAG8163014.1 hypothetical protein KVR01_007492 [Diaporthe batatas]
MEDDVPPTDQASKPRRLRQKDLEELRDKHQIGEDKMIPIWQRADHKAPLTPFVEAFSRAALAIFSPVWKKKLEANPEYLVIDGKHLDVYMLILDWIKLCIDEGNDVKFPDIEEFEADPEQREDERPHQLHVLLEVIAVANLLKIPEGSLQNGLKKRAPGYARRHLIDLGFVERLYAGEANGELAADLREAAAISIFEAWWTYKLEGPEYDQYMSFLEQMRVEYPQLDKDIHEQFNKKKEYIEGKREEKRRARAAEAAGLTGGLDSATGAADVGGGWDTAAVEVTGGVGDAGDGWSQAAALVTTEGPAPWETTSEEAPAWAASSGNSMW